MSKKVRETRDRVNRILVSVTPTEREEIKRKANIAGMSVSAYLRAASLNHNIRSTLDLDRVRDLIRVNGDLYRFGGVLKLWLAERPNEGCPSIEVEKVLKDLEELKQEIRQKIGRL